MNQEADPRPGTRKSTLLLVLVLLCLAGAALSLALSLHSFLTATGAGPEYTAVTATVTALRRQRGGAGKQGRDILVPVLRFNYRGQWLTRPAPGLGFRHGQPPAGGPGRLRTGDRIRVLVHDYTGTIIIPPTHQRRVEGLWQASAGALFLLLAWGLCRLRSRPGPEK
ncbi:MAG TPA: hypothetical protein ENK27_08585 [Desulfobulbus sp.]|nr:hypothetical protein [Desulfobulbus sp.]